MNNENSNEINLSELAINLIENPEKTPEILKGLEDSEVLEDLYDALFAELGEYDKPYNIEQNTIILQIQKQISARIDQLKSYDLLKDLNEEHSVLECESVELSEELSIEENSNEIGE